MVQGRHKHSAETFSPTGEAECPKNITGAGKALFCKLAKQLPLSNIDSHTLAAFVTCVVRWQECEAILDKEGLAPGGKIHPLAKQADCLLRHIRGFAGELGLSPKARNKFEITPKQDTKLQDFLKNVADDG